jgi:hypothetical protein
MHFSIGTLAFQFFGAPAVIRKNALAEAATDASAQTIAAAWNPLTSAGLAAPRTPPRPSECDLSTIAAGRAGDERALTGDR